MVKKKLLVLLAFTSQGMEANQDLNIDNQLQSQDINSIDSQLQNQDNRKTLYIVSGSAAAVAIAGGAIWLGTKKDKKTTEEQQGQQDQQPIEEREFNEQDINDVLKLNTREELFKLFEVKIKSHEKTIKKMNEELEKLPNNLSDIEKEQKYKEILDNNKFARDVMVAIYTLMMFSLPFVMAKEFLNKYKNNDQIKNNKQLVKVFDDLLKIWPLKAKSYLVYGSSCGIASVLKELNKRDFLKKLQDAVKQEESQLENEEKVLCKTSSEVKNIMQITNLTEEDQMVLRRIRHIIWDPNSSINPKSYKDTGDVLGVLLGMPCFQKEILKKIFKEATKNSSILQELQKSIDLLEDKLLKEKLLY